MISFLFEIQFTKIQHRSHHFTSLIKSAVRTFRRIDCFWGQCKQYGHSSDKPLSWSLATRSTSGYPPALAAAHTSWRPTRPCPYRTQGHWGLPRFMGLLCRGSRKCPTPRIGAWSLSGLTPSYHPPTHTGPSGDHSPLPHGSTPLGRPARRWQRLVVHTPPLCSGGHKVWMPVLASSHSKGSSSEMYCL